LNLKNILRPALKKLSDENLSPSKLGSRFIVHVVLAVVLLTSLTGWIAYTYIIDKVSLDVGWAPTPYAAAREGLIWAGVGIDDIFYELGCGDGRVAIEAAKLGAYVICVEKDPFFASKARAAIAASGFDGRITVLEQDLFDVDLSDATVVFVFLLPALNGELRKTFELQLSPGAKIVSREFEIPGWPKGDRLELPGFLFLKWTVGESTDVQ
jgi:SAM-dependent methyltransferase